MSNQNRVELNIPANMKYLNVVGASIAAIMEHLNLSGDVESSVYEIQLAVHEICTNIIEHAYNNDDEQRILLEISIKQVNTTLVISLFDNSGFEFSETAVKVPDVEELQERGMGLMLARKIMDEVKYEHSGKQNCWTLTKYFAQ